MGAEVRIAACRDTLSGETLERLVPSDIAKALVGAYLGSGG